MEVGLRHHDDEFLAAIPAGEIDAADRLADPFREFAQHVIAGIVAVTVIDRLEIIDVQHHQFASGLPRFAACFGEHGEMLLSI